MGARGRWNRGLLDLMFLPPGEQVLSFTLCSHFGLREYCSFMLTSQKVLFSMAALPSCHRYVHPLETTSRSLVSSAVAVMQPSTPRHCRTGRHPTRKAWALPPSSLKRPSAPGNRWSAFCLYRVAHSDHLRIESYSLRSCLTWEAVTSVNPTAPSPGQVITVSQALQLFAVLLQ